MLENGVTKFKPILSSTPNILLIWVLYRNWLMPLSKFSILCPIFLSIVHWDAYIPLKRILKDLLCTLLGMYFLEMLHYSPLRNIHPQMTLHIISKSKRVIFENTLTNKKHYSLWIFWFTLTLDDSYHSKLIWSFIFEIEELPLSYT